MISLKEGLHQEQTIGDSYRIIASTYLGHFTAIVTGFVIRSFLGPHLMGIWSYIQVIQYYANYAQCGVLSAAERELPYCRGKKDYSRAENIKNTSFTFTHFASTLTFLGILIYAFTVWGNVEFSYFIGLMVVAVLALLGQYGLYYTVLLRTEKNFTVISIGKILFALNWLFFTLLLVIPFDIYGIYAVAILVLLIELSYYIVKVRHSFHFQIDFGELQSLISVGAPLLILGVSITTMMNIDKIVIANLLGSTELGYYSIAAMASGFIFSLPNAFSLVMYPRFQEAYGVRSNLSDIERYLRVPTMILAYTIPVVIGISYILLPLLIQWILPSYTPGIGAMKILLLGTFFISISHMANQFLITVGKQTKTSVFLMALVGIALLLDYGFIRMDMGINGVALGTALSYALYYLILISYAMKHYVDWKGVFHFYLRTQIPAIALFLLVFLLDLLFPHESQSTASLLTIAVWKLLLFCSFCIPFLWRINKETGILMSLFRVLQSNLKEFSTR